MSAFSPATDRTARCARRETPSRAPEGLRGGPGTEGSCAWKSYPQSMTNEEDSEATTDNWAEFDDDDGEPIGTAELKRLNLTDMPEEIRVRVLDDDFPEVTLWREDTTIVCEIEEHLYTKYWKHKFSAYAFAEAMEMAIRRLTHEGHPLSNPELDDDDVHIFVRWQLRRPHTTTAEELASSVQAAFDLVWHRADAILKDSDSVLVLGKDTDAGLDRLTAIASHLRELGYFPYIIKEQPDKVGEGVIQKVMRLALSSKFVIVENTEASGHLYEIPHVTKAAECVTVVLQEEGKGATWMFEDAYLKHRHWKKITYADGGLDEAVDAAAKWAEEFVREFGVYQKATLPWLRSQQPSSP